MHKGARSVVVVEPCCSAVQFGFGCCSEYIELKMSRQNKKRKVDVCEKQKGTHKSLNRRSQGRKSQFYGNIYTSKKSTVAPCASAEKLRAGDEDIIYDETYSYKIIDFHSVLDEISNLVVCSSRHNKVKFRVATSAGLGLKIAVECEECGNAYINSGPKIKQAKATIFVEKRDNNRIKLANKRHLTESKEARAALRAAASALETMYEEQEGQSYGRLIVSVKKSKFLS